MTTRLTRWLTTLDNFEAKMAQLPAVRRYGRLTRATGLVLEATGLQLPLGATCVIERQNGSETHEVESEVVGFNGQRLFLMPLEEVEGVLPGARVYAKNISAEGRARSVVIAAPADVSPLLRMQGAAYATRIAEDFRDRGQHVLLIMDSLTRYAMAQREIALAIGEPPATKGYPPSVFAKLPALVERAGNGISGGGSITAFYTVLTEGDDQQDPIADSARAILDGHIVLSRRLAEAGHYPAIDIEASISRAMTALISEQHYARVRTFKQLLSSFQRNRDLVSVGAYAKGSDPMLDKAIALWPQLEGYLQQGIFERADWEASLQGLERIFPTVS
ncbi:TPA: hypothetical protein M2G79_000922 [Escherichia coli]|nr:hypothetical protein [Escherichia coli]EIH5089146.1 hypothetical protein [Escherichia coli]EIH8946833.1 hypothetical protein [Escherichia coli]HCB8428960.1 hypothetical protein [Escherichia coli]HCB8460101.1 hypothetical protein [Escherichia coli]